MKSELARLRETLIGFAHQHPTVPAGQQNAIADDYLRGLPKCHTSGFGGDTSCVEVFGAGAPCMLDDPEPCWGSRVEANTVDGGKSYAHCEDSEATRVLPIDLGEDVALYRDADLCYFDAQYTLHEFLSHMNWGHSTAPIGLEMALREGVRKILFAHHDPAASDLKISDAERQTSEFFASYQLAAQKGGRSLPPLEWSIARDGDCFALGTLIR